VNKSLLYFSILILVSNFLFFVVGILANIGFVGTFMGGLMAIGTDPVILMLGALLGAGLVVKPFRFSVIYLVIGAIFLTMLVHVILGTTRFIVDMVRFDALLIISALIIIVLSFFGPKSKASTKKTKVKIKPLVKTNKDSNKGLRSILLIITLSVSTFLLVIPTPRDSLVGENVTQYVLKPFFTTSRIQKCTYKVWNKNFKIPAFKCNTINLDKFITKHNLEKNISQLDKWIDRRINLLPELPLKIEGQMYGTEKVRQIGTFYLQKKYRTNDRVINKIINILHPTLLIVLVFFIWRLRFCITGITISLFRKIKAEI
jgi:hypothetical protein